MGRASFVSPGPFSIGAVTDEFSPEDLDRALGAMAELGMTFAELRVVNGRNILEHTDAGGRRDPGEGRGSRDACPRDRIAGP